MEIILLMISNLIFMVLGYFMCYLMIPNDKKEEVGIKLTQKYDELEEAYIPEEE